MNFIKHKTKSKAKTQFKANKKIITNPTPRRSHTHPQIFTFTFINKMTAFWNKKMINPKEKTSIILTKSNGNILELNVGDCIRYTGFNNRPDGIKITSFTGTENNEGPIGMTYVPWRKDEKKWAEPIFSMRGGRHVICYPVGMQHYGEHIEWDNVEIIDNPELL